MSVNEIRVASFFFLPKAVHQAARDGNIATGCSGLQIGVYDRPVVLGMPGTPDGNVGNFFIQEDAVPLKRQYFLPSKSCIQPDHHKEIRWQILDGVKKEVDLLVT